MCFGSRRPTRVPLLNARHRVALLAWAREGKDWNVEDWKRVAWSKESRFRILNTDGRTPRSLDLNPIEHLWDVLEYDVEGHHTAPTYLIELWTALANIWQVIAVERFQKLVEYVPCRQGQRRPNSLLGRIVCDVGHDECGVLHSAEWHDDDWSNDETREAWLWFFIWAKKLFGFLAWPPEDITYVELSLPREHHSVTTVRRKEPPTEYANIDLHSHLHLQTIVVEREEEEEVGNNTCETPLMSNRRESAV
ncbi:transposable element Tc1 transposase [Trichonephila clavipes]|nr:transposable element Tc1 transposase [Trichonephila clavipes]